MFLLAADMDVTSSSGWIHPASWELGPASQKDWDLGLEGGEAEESVLRKRLGCNPLVKVEATSDLEKSFSIAGSNFPSTR